ncbi:pc-esterase domain-containing protein [Dermatophagoides farinae]|uniref:Pc-esterase domain-containing protein n=1 Tax=Dermatophagoides farinae TaxID=6954 RepID=A0A9D4P664_DERFA|nr:pc-esterase domain-containing protein [Dermatophagoides farinae]
MAKQMDAMMAIRQKKRFRFIHKRLDSMLNKIKKATIVECPQQQQQQGRIYLPSSLYRLMNNNNEMFHLWNNLNITLMNMNQCDIIVIDDTIDYHQLIKTTTTTINNDQTMMMTNTHLNSRQLYRQNIEQLTLLIKMPDIRCNLFDLVRKYPALRQQPLSPLCFTLPQNLQKFLDVSDALGYSTNWTLEYGHYHNNNQLSSISEPLQIFSQTDRSRLIQINRLALRQQSQSSSLHTMMISTPLLGPIIIRQHFIQQVVHYHSQPIKLRIFVLITSLNPLRVFQYQYGLILPYKQNNNKSPSSNNNNNDDDDDPLDSLENFWNHLQQSSSNNDMKMARQSVHRVILYSLILMEVNDRLLNLQSSPDAIYPSAIQSFQCLIFDIVIRHTENYQAFIVNLLSIDQLEQLELGQHEDKLSTKLLNQFQLDTYRLLAKSTQNLNDKNFDKFSIKLRELIDGDHFGLLGINCHISHNVCLSQQDLEYLINSWNQMDQMRDVNFESIYPYRWQNMTEYSNIRALFEQILLQIDTTTTTSNSENNNNNDNQISSQTKEMVMDKYKHFEYQTERLHPVVEAMFAQIVEDNKSSLPLNDVQHFDVHHDLTNLNWTTMATITGDNHNIDIDDEIINHKIECTNDPYSLSQLKHLKILYPNDLELRPKFQPYQKHYNLNQPISYDNMLIQIDTEVAHCDTWIRLDNHYYNIQSGRLNFSLGIGENSIRLTLVNRKLSDSNMVLAIYTIVIHRQTLLESSSSSSTQFIDYEQQQQQQQQQQKQQQQQYQICNLIQDCDLRVYPNESCGWQSTNQTCTKTTILNNNNDCLKQIDQIETKKICQHGAENGRWLLPCINCTKLNGCIWSELQWLPYRCRYRIPVEPEHLRKCLSNKNILLIGDSTNRGIMHYIMERLNRTLTEADKTHDHKSYRLIDLDTTINFAYYPKFWLPPNQRPSFAQVFHDSLHQTLLDDKMIEPIKNIIIIGGVQWISRQHLHIARQELRSLGFTNDSDDQIRLVVKTLGSGFHQSVIGVHYMPVSEQIKLALQNQLLIDEALRLNFEVIDTFNKTIAMYKDFYPGKCACHFHRIIKEKTPDGTSIRYHVEGKLNRLYSEILLSRICDTES